VLYDRPEEDPLVALVPGADDRLARVLVREHRRRGPLEPAAGRAPVLARPLEGEALDEAGRGGVVGGRSAEVAPSVKIQ
jgi:hypothetical protein